MPQVLQVASRSEVAIVGAGPAGSALARHLAREGIKVTLFERSGFNRPRVGETLAPSVNALLRGLGVWPEFLALQPVPSFGTKSLWGSSEPATHSHLRSAYGNGWHVERMRFDHMLAVAALDAGAALRLRTEVADVAWEAGTWRIAWRKGETRGVLQARVLVDASGKPARIARRLGAMPVRLDRLVGIGACCRAPAHEEAHILLETCPAGWWYTAPLDRDHLIVFLMTDSDICRRLSLGSPDHWVQRLSSVPNTKVRLKSATIGAPAVHAASSQRLLRQDLRRPWLAVGDASLSVDPLSGSGVVRALRSARRVADTVGAMLADVGSRTVCDYERACDHAFNRYLDERAAYYAAETRWSGAEFWQRRQLHHPINHWFNMGNGQNAPQIRPSKLG